MRIEVFGVLACVVMSTLAWPAREQPAPHAAGAVIHDGELSRLRAHFDSVDRELRRADVSTLTDSQRASRQRIIAWLRDYRHAGIFPRNDRFPAKAMPYFRDSRGVPCAMAYLVAQSGRQDIVDHIASTRNNAFIRELADDRDLVRWVDSVGLTLDEAARIQPQYQADPETTVDASYALATVIVSGAALTTTGLNAVAPSVTSGLIGVVTGGAATLTGLAILVSGTQTTNDKDTAKLAAANLVAGTLSLGLGIRGIAVARRKGASATNHKRQASFIHTPAVVPGRYGPQVALSFSSRF